MACCCVVELREMKIPSGTVVASLETGVGFRNDILSEALWMGEEWCGREERGGCARRRENMRGIG